MSQAQRCTPLIPVLKKQKQADLSELQATLVYTISSRSGGHTVRPCHKKTNKQKTYNY